MIYKRYPFIKTVLQWLFSLLICAVVTEKVISADLNILIIGSTRDAGVAMSNPSANSAPFLPGQIRTELQNILVGAGLGTVNVALEEHYGENGGYRAYNLASWFHWPYPADVETTTRWPNLRGETGTAWDYVILIGDPYTMENTPGLYTLGVAKIGEEVAKGTAETILLMPWPATGSTSTLNHYKEVVYRTGRSAGYKVAPAGLAWQAAGSPTGTTHPSSDGAYIAAASIYSRIWSKNAKDSNHTYNDALADTVYNTVTANAGAPQFTGKFSFQNPFLMLGDKRRDIHFSEKGTSTEYYFKERIAQVLTQCRVSYNYASYSSTSTTGADKYNSSTPADDGLGWPINNAMPIAWNLGRDYGVADPSKDYVVNPDYWQLAFGFEYQPNTWSLAVATANDQHIGLMHSDDFRLANKMRSQAPTARNLPVRTLWAQMHQVYPTLNPLVDGTGPHLNWTLDDVVGAYFYAIYSGRCPVDPGVNFSSTVALDMKNAARWLGYEAAWRLGRCEVRAPGFKVLPSVKTALTVTPTTAETMTVNFIRQPWNEVTVNVGVSAPSAAIVNPKTLTYDPTNHATYQSVKVIGIPGASAAEEFNVQYTTASTDESFNGLDDSWKYTNNRTATQTLAAVAQADRPVAVTKNTAKTISLNVSGSASTNTTIAQPFHGTLTWSGADVIYTPNTDYVGSDSFAFAVVVNGTLTKGYIIITVANASAYNTWSSGATYDLDSNNDGVSNGIAWLLGAANTSSNATSLLPTMDRTTDPNYFIFTYRRSDIANTDPNTTITVQRSSDLITWSNVEEDGTNIIITPINDFYGTGIDKVEVKIKITLSSDGKLFSRLNISIAP